MINPNDEASVRYYLVDPIFRNANLGDVRPEISFTREHPVRISCRPDYLIRFGSVKAVVEVKAGVYCKGVESVIIEEYMRITGRRHGFVITPYKMAYYYEYRKGDTVRFIKRSEIMINNPENVDEAISGFISLLDIAEGLENMKVITINSAKGGVGKTSLVFNMAYELAEMGNKVLMIDTDRQANLSMLAGVNRADELEAAPDYKTYKDILDSFSERKEITNLLRDAMNSNFSIMKYVKECPELNKYLENKKGNIYIVPGSYRTTPEKISTLGGANILLKEALLTKKSRELFDYVLIDTPPNLNIITENALIASDYLIIPTHLEYLSIYGIMDSINFLIRANKVTENKCRILGIVPTCASNRVNSYIAGHDAIDLFYKDYSKLPEFKKRTFIQEACNLRRPVRVHLKFKNVLGGKEALSDLNHFIDDMIERITKGN